MTNKLTSADHKEAIAQLMKLVVPFIHRSSITPPNTLEKVLVRLQFPGNWKREGKRKNEKGEIVRRFHMDQGSWVDTFETELAPGKWSVGVQIVEADAWVVLAYREFIKSLGEPEIKGARDLDVKPIYPDSMSDAENKPTGYGAFA